MLTGKQKRYLRSLAAKMTPLLQVGKSGISDNVITQLDDALTARELTKVRVLPNCPLEASEAASILSERTQSELIQVIGRNVVLYRRGKEPKIELPD
uniref:ribosome assembly RNA-binding protein YhbY n=1 Tax=Syntrophaceticus schinkii TaxID=499207 RepID=UPI0005CBDB9D